MNLALLKGHLATVPLSLLCLLLIFLILLLYFIS